MIVASCIAVQGLETSCDELRSKPIWSFTLIYYLNTNLGD